MWTFSADTVKCIIMNDFHGIFYTNRYNGEVGDVVVGRIKEVNVVRNAKTILTSVDNSKETSKVKVLLYSGWAEAVESGHICQTGFSFNVIICKSTWWRAGICTLHFL